MNIITISMFQLLIIAAIAVATVFSLHNGSTSPLNCKGVLSTIHKDRISLLALISLVTTFLGSLNWLLFYYDSYYYCYYRYSSVNSFGSTVYPYVYLNFSKIIGFLLNLAPIILLCLYFLMKQSNKYAYKLVILAIASKALIALTFNGTTNPLSGTNGILSIPFCIVRIFRNSYGFNYVMHNAISVLEGLAIIATVVAAILAFLGKANHKLFKYTLIVCFILIALNLLLFFIGYIPYFIERTLYFDLFAIPCYYIGEALFLVVLWLFVTKNELPRFAIKDGLPKNNPKEITPEMQLIALKDKLELGIINEEEYKAQRAEIISKL